MPKKLEPPSCPCPEPLAYRSILRAEFEAQDLRKGVRTALRIRWAACELLEKTSPDLLKVQDICAHIGIAQGTLYQYFPDRDRLLESLLQDFVGFLRERMEAATQGSHRPQESAELATRAYCMLFEQNRGLMKCLLNHYEAFPKAREILEAFNEGWIDTVVKSIKKNRQSRSAARSGPRTQDVELRRRAYALGGMVDQYLSWVYLYGDEKVAAQVGDTEAMVHTLSFIWCQTFREEFADPDQPA